MTSNNVLRYDKDKFESYIILESHSSSQSKCLHVVNLTTSDQEFTIGRGKDSDIRISDISVSRFHAMIKVSPEGKIQLFDNKSKFGTLIQVQRPILLNVFDELHLQAG